MRLKGKHIILGLTGSIAAYKAAYLLRGLVKEGAEVQVVMTPAAKEFITPVTMSALSGRPVASEFFAANDGTWHSHVDMGQWADLMLIAPVTAATLGKMAHGIADNLLVTTYMSAKCPVYLAPAMDLDMFKHPSTLQNLEILRSFGNVILEPGEGELASGLHGKGRMQEPEQLVEEVVTFFNSKKKLLNKKVLVTAGPTFEKIDPVRFIGNYSSGKMGFALAEELAEAGASVTLVTGPVSLATTHPSIQRIDVESAAEMHQACLDLFSGVDAAIMCAAVADYRPKHAADQKIKRTAADMQIDLEATADIAASLGQLKTDKQLLVGFALETNDEKQNALGKMQKKNLDFIVLNSLQDAGAGFGGNTNKITILSKDNNAQEFELKHKREVAADIVGKLIQELAKL
ncbi:bifunctional phosphopantothenoylcysteine decarboxylase/phosphopantothenate--cysteine ligase CoaBC [Sunxiuqinia rutila]|uniref:bifunctional phosphopantothenoylcysteine decarboxylase/phosphopantothenate--cysteine ligase CoaBC n=1 Tax=Sunxiuqinia rutila TaxID=1397841 RepID=UPI003D369A45